MTAKARDQYGMSYDDPDGNVVSDEVDTTNVGTHVNKIICSEELKYYHTGAKLKAIEGK